MRNKLLAAFALFSLFFGAGNLILPPFLGVQAGEDWSLVALGFVISAVLIPILGIFAHAKLQGTIYDFGAPLGKGFSLVYAALIYGIALALPAPRTASVTHEMAVMPYVDSPYWLTSLLYFTFVFVVAMNRSKILDFFGKITTPLILLVLTALIVSALWAPEAALLPSSLPNPFGAALLEGYQTFDAIAAVVIGGVLIVSIHKSRSTAASNPAVSIASSTATTPVATPTSTASAAQTPAHSAQASVHAAANENTLEGPQQMKKTLRFAAVFSATALALIYVGLIYAGAQSQGAFTPESSRTDILQGVAQMFLGGPGVWALSVLVSLACFTTAVGVVTGTADYVASFFPAIPARKVYVATAALGSVLGVLMGQLPVVHIIAIAVPALVFIYPFTIILMALHVLPAAWARPHAFKAAIVVCALANTPAFLDSLGYSGLQAATTFMPLSGQGLAWVLPVLGTVFVCKLIKV